MGRLGLALGYIISGDERLLNEYNLSFSQPLPQLPIQTPPSKEWLEFVRKHNGVSDMAKLSLKPSRKLSNPSSGQRKEL